MNEPYYKDNLVTIYHGDCAEIVPELGRFDLLLTDPPYGIDVLRGMDNKDGKRVGKGNRNVAPIHYEYSKWDTKPPSDDLMMGLISTSKFACVWGG